MTDNTEELIDETEAQLLDAMSVEELPVYKAYAGQELTVGQTKAKMYDIVEAIKTVFDPEIPINVYDLGLIYKINAGVPGVGKVEVEVVWEPAWTLERLSDDARMMLEMI